MIVMAGAMTGTGADGVAEPPVDLAGGHSVELCLDPADRRLTEYAEGRRRAVLALHAASGGGPPLVVVADTGEETTIGVFPDDAFKAASPAAASRFFLPGSPATRCWTVALAGGGSARVALELSPPLD